MLTVAVTAENDNIWIVDVDGTMHQGHARSGYRFVAAGVVGEAGMTRRRRPSGCHVSPDGDRPIDRSTDRSMDRSAER